VLPTVNLTIERRAVDGTNVARGLPQLQHLRERGCASPAPPGCGCGVGSRARGSGASCTGCRVRPRWFRAIGSHDGSAPRSASATRTARKASKRCVEPTRLPAGSAQHFAS
jgi:hypothetical protein